MKLNSLIIKDFKGIENLEINFNGKNFNVYGENGTGKTTIYDAWLWLWSGKDNDNQTKFPIKPIKNEKVIHNLLTSVEANIDFDENEYLFKKEFSEVWTLPRKCPTKKLTSHKTNYYINNVPIQTETEYNEAINNIIDDEKFKILSNPLYFNTKLNTEQKRSILFSFLSFICYLFQFFSSF